LSPSLMDSDEPSEPGVTMVAVVVFLVISAPFVLANEMSFPTSKSLIVSPPKFNAPVTFNAVEMVDEPMEAVPDTVNVPVAVKLVRTGFGFIANVTLLAPDVMVNAFDGENVLKVGGLAFARIELPSEDVPATVMLVLDGRP
jgi:hypothetical protein